MKILHYVTPKRFLIGMLWLSCAVALFASGEIASTAGFANAAFAIALLGYLLRDWQHYDAGHEWLGVLQDHYKKQITLTDEFDRKICALRDDKRCGYDVEYLRSEIMSAMSEHLSKSLEIHRETDKVMAEGEKSNGRVKG